jgi:hypothetical protein
MEDYILKKVFLDELPRGGEYLTNDKINWKKSIGYKVKFVYDDIEGEVEIVDYNSMNRNIFLKYKDYQPFEIVASSFRNCSLGGLLQEEFKFEYDEKSLRRIDLRHLQMDNKGGIDWEKAVGNSFYFLYDGFDGFIDIVDYVKQGQILTLKFEDKISKCKSSDVLKCKIKTVIGKRDTDFKYKVGDIINTNYCKLKITERIRKYEDSHKGNMKWYKYECCSCGWSNGEIRENDLKTKKKGSCPRCSDGISMPNKLGFNLLEQLNIVFKREYCPDWIKPKRYDFYFELNNKKYIIEMDGAFHIKNNNMSGQTVKESKSVDDFKDKLARDHDIEVIRIDCEISDLKYIKNSILHSKLATMFDLSKIDWLKCQEYACSSLVKQTCDLWNSGIESTIKIGRILNLDKGTIIRYLKIGTELNMCNYKPKKANYIGINNEDRKKPVMCLETHEIYNSISEATRKTKLNNISACCRGVKKSASGYTWMYYDEYLKLHSENINNIHMAN